MLILDLDGTLLAVNSFPRWALHLARGRFPHLGRARRARIVGAALTLLARRKLRLIDHETLKWRLQKLWQAATAGDGGASAKSFAQEMTRFVRPELAPVLADVAGGGVDAVLATAAVGDYADGLGRALGFTHIVATPAGRAATEPSTVGENKRHAVWRLLVGRGWQDRPRVLFTDHVDDLPLMRICQTVYWFGTSAGREAVEHAAPGLSIRSGLAGGWGSRAPIDNIKGS